MAHLYEGFEETRTVPGVLMQIHAVDARQRTEGITGWKYQYLESWKSVRGKMWKYRNRKYFYFKLLFNDQKSFWGAFSDVIWKNPFSISVRVISASLLQSWGKMGCKQTWTLLFFYRSRFVNINLKNVFFLDWVHPPKNIEKSHLQRCFRIWGMTAIDSKWL